MRVAVNVEAVVRLKSRIHAPLQQFFCAKARAAEHLVIAYGTLRSECTNSVRG